MLYNITQEGKKFKVFNRTENKFLDKSFKSKKKALEYVLKASKPKEEVEKKTKKTKKRSKKASKKTKKTKKGSKKAKKRK